MNAGSDTSSADLLFQIFHTWGTKAAVVRKPAARPSTSVRSTGSFRRLALAFDQRAQPLREVQRLVRLLLQPAGLAFGLDHLAQDRVFLLQRAQRVPERG